MRIKTTGVAASRARARPNRVSIAHTLVASLLSLACAGGQVDSEAQVASVGLVTVLPGAATLAIGDSVRLEAVVLGPGGDTLPDPVVEWRTANGSIATVSSEGVVRAFTPGLAGITAVVGDRVGTARIVVTAGGPVPRVAGAQNAPAQQTPVKADTSQARRSEPPPARPSAPVRQAQSGEQTGGGTRARIPMTEEAARRRMDGSAHPNEPAGFRPLADRAFLTKATADKDRGDRECRGGSECWDGAEFRYRNFSIIEDSSAPFSCCSIARMRYPAGHRSGTAPGTVQTTGFRPQVEELYVSIWARLSSNWYGNQSGTNKMFFLGLGRGGNNIFLSAEGNGSNTLEPQIRLQGVPDSRARIRPNRSHRPLERGVWQHWEFYFRLNEPGVADGVAKLWIDGELVTEAANVQFRGADQATRRWWIFHWSPTYGGGGAPVPAEQYLDFDHVYVSGK